MRPGAGEFRLGALAGSAVGAIGGLFAIGVARAIIYQNPARLFDLPILALLSWVVGGVTGWFMGGFVGPRFGERFRSPRAELVAGALAGVVPVILIGLWGWYMVRGH